MWDYAKLSKTAKLYGGPEQLIAKIIEYGRTLEHKNTTPKLVAASGLGILGGFVVSKIIEHFRNKELVSTAAFEEAKQELIQGIKDYDAVHPEESDTQEKNKPNTSAEIE